MVEGHSCHKSQHTDNTTSQSKSKDMIHQHSQFWKVTECTNLACGLLKFRFWLTDVLLLLTQEGSFDCSRFSAQGRHQPPQLHWFQFFSPTTLSLYPHPTWALLFSSPPALHPVLPHPECLFYVHISMRLKHLSHSSVHSCYSALLVLCSVT